jgi:hypothetical protein
MPRGGTNR